MDTPVIVFFEILLILSKLIVFDVLNDVFDNIFELPVDKRWSAQTSLKISLGIKLRGSRQMKPRRNVCGM